VEGRGAAVRQARDAAPRAQMRTGAAAETLPENASPAPSADAACLPCGPILTPLLVFAGSTHRRAPSLSAAHTFACAHFPITKKNCTTMYRTRAQNATPRSISTRAGFARVCAIHGCLACVCVRGRPR
jgi:hypothetical protein